MTTAHRREWELMRMMLANQPDTDGLEDFVTFRCHKKEASILADLRSTTPLGTPIDLNRARGSVKALFVAMALDPAPLRRWCL